MLNPNFIHSKIGKVVPFRSPFAFAARRDMEVQYTVQVNFHGAPCIVVDGEEVELLTDYTDHASKKEQSRALAAVFGRLEQNALAVGDSEAAEKWRKRAFAVGKCGDFLLFAEGMSTHRKTLVGAHFCGHRLCPECAKRRSLRDTAILTEAMERLLKDHPELRLIHIGLTVPNCCLDDIRATFDAMQAAFASMMAQPFFAQIFKYGYYLKKELTLSSDPEMVEAGTIAHPHFHVLALVDEAYFADSPLACKHTGRQWVSHLTTIFRRLQFDPRGVAAECKTYQEYVCCVRAVVAEALMRYAQSEGWSADDEPMWRTKYRKTFQRLLQHLDDKVHECDPVAREQEAAAQLVLMDASMRGVQLAARRVDKRWAKMEAQKTVKFPDDVDSEEQLLEVAQQKARLCAMEKYKSGGYSDTAMQRVQASAKRALAEWLHDVTNLQYIDEKKQKLLLNSWRAAMGDDVGVIKNVDIRLVRSKADMKARAEGLALSDMDDMDVEAMKDAVKEMVKYIAKDAEYIIVNDPKESERRVEALDRELYQLKMHTEAGLIREYMKKVQAEWKLSDSEEEGLNRTSGKSGMLVGEEIELLLSDWTPKLHAYRVTREPCTADILLRIERERGVFAPKWLREYAGLDGDDVAEFPNDVPKSQSGSVPDFDSLLPDQQAALIWHTALMECQAARADGWSVDALQWGCDHDGYPFIIRGEDEVYTEPRKWLEQMWLADVKPHLAESLSDATRDRYAEIVRGLGVA